MERQQDLMQDVFLAISHAQQITKQLLGQFLIVMQQPEKSVAGQELLPLHQLQHRRLHQHHQLHVILKILKKFNVRTDVDHQIAH